VIVHVNEAGVASVLPARSVALTWNVWLPVASALYACGLVHVVQVPPSSWHWKVEPDSVEVNANDALVDEVELGGDDVIVVSGAVVSIVQVELALPVLPAGSVPVTVKVCEPAARPV
jgi:hypothetical protein